MNAGKMKRIKAAGYKVTTADEWLGLTPEESQLVDIRLALAEQLEEVRKEKGISQAQLAARMGTKQSGIARMVNRPETSSMDNLVKGLIALGVPISKIAACLILCTGTN